jgi:hypothetical protein
LAEADLSVLHAWTSRLSWLQPSSHDDLAIMKCVKTIDKKRIEMTFSRFVFDFRF